MRRGRPSEGNGLTEHGRLIEANRESRGITLEKFAELLEEHLSYAHNLPRKRQLTLFDALRLKKLFGMKFEVLEPRYADWLRRVLKKVGP